MNKVEKYIANNWDNTIVFQPNDEGTLIGLPYPYTCPTTHAVLHELYYWDTFFTNKGLILSGKAHQAKNNVDNLLFLVNKYGFVPGGNRTYYLANSQEPFLSHMVYDIYQYYKDPVWLRSAYELLVKEYMQHWQTDRMTPSGLNNYNGKILSESEKIRLYELGHKRIGDMSVIYGDRSDDMEYIVKCQCADGESGWDCNPRMIGRKILGNWVDCNSNLYAYEKNFAYFCRELSIDDAEKWEAAAEKRANLMRKLMWNGECFNDYDFDADKKLTLLSTACFYPLAAGLCTNQEAEISKNTLLEKLEYDFGLSTCEINSLPGNYQWNYPNGWPCQQFMAVKGLDNYGFTDDAQRIAKKYITTVENVFEKTGELWEKYNVVDGTIKVRAEYKMPTMMGWTAGTYMAFKNYINTGKI